MFKIFRESFKTANNSIILVTPLILFCTAFACYFHFLIEQTDSVPKHMLSIITMFVVISGLLGSWLYTVKKGLVFARQVFIFDHERNKALRSTVSNMFKGFGRLFLPCSGYIAMNILVMLLAYSAVAYVTVVIPQLKYYMSVIALILAYIITFLTVLWIPEIVYNEKNALFALYNSVIKVLTHIKDAVILYIFIIGAISSIIALIKNYLFDNPIVSFILIMGLYYIIFYIIVLLFTYYEQTFIKSEE